MREGVFQGLFRSEALKCILDPSFSLLGIKGSLARAGPCFQKADLCQICCTRLQGAAPNGRTAERRNGGRNLL